MCRSMFMPSKHTEPFLIAKRRDWMEIHQVSTLCIFLPEYLLRPTSNQDLLAFSLTTPIKTSTASISEASTFPLLHTSSGKHFTSSSAAG